MELTYFQFYAIIVKKIIILYIFSVQPGMLQKEQQRI